MSRYQELRVDDEVWITIAVLQQRYPNREDFSISEILAHAETANLTGRRTLRPSFENHVRTHCVANRPPSSSDSRLIFATSRGRRRLPRPSDPIHTKRSRGKRLPELHALPGSLQHLLQWYHNQYVKYHQAKENDPVLALRGVGKEIWSNESADEYVRRIRSDW